MSCAQTDSWVRRKLNPPWRNSHYCALLHGKEGPHVKNKIKNEFRHESRTHIQIIPLELSSQGALSWIQCTMWVYFLPLLTQRNFLTDGRWVSGHGLSLQQQQLPEQPCPVSSWLSLCHLSRTHFAQMPHRKLNCDSSFAAEHFWDRMGRIHHCTQTQGWAEQHLLLLTLA